VGERIKELRNARGWTAKQLADRCAEVGAPELTAPVIANIETGRRVKDGRRRRDVTIDEVLTFALAFEVPPDFLFLPLNGDEMLQVTGTTQMDVLSAASWMNGEWQALRYLANQAFPRTQEERERWARWRRNSAPLTVLRNIWLWTRLLRDVAAGHRVYGAPDLGEVARADRVEMLLDADVGNPHDQAQIDAALREQTATVARLVDWMTSMGFTPPPLPQRIIDVIREQNMLEVARPDELLVSNGRES
jgi:transcriptional regulator with XRE-family HTH domain